MNVSASPWKTIPTTIMKATGCIPKIKELVSSILPDAMQRADIGMMNIPTVMEVSAVRFRIICVTRLTVRTTTKGFTLAYQEGEAPSPAKRSTYLGIVAYSWCCTIQNPVIMMIKVISRPLLQTLIKAFQICPNVLPSPECWALL